MGFFEGKERKGRWEKGIVFSLVGLGESTKRRNEWLV